MKHRSLSRLPRGLGRAGLVLACAVVGVGVVDAITSVNAATNAGTLNVLVSSGGSLVTPSGPQGSAAVFALQPPTGASCTGDTSSGGYHVSTYMVPSSVDPGTLAFDSGGPSPQNVGAAFREPLFSAGTPVVNKNTAVGTGLVTGLPTFDFTAYAGIGAASIPAGLYNVGIACTLGTTVDKYWNVQLTFAVAADDQPSGVTWQLGVVTPPTTTTIAPTTTTIAPTTTTIAPTTTTIAPTTTTIAPTTTTIAPTTTTIAPTTTTIAPTTTTIAPTTTTIAPTTTTIAPTTTTIAPTTTTIAPTTTTIAPTTTTIAPTTTTIAPTTTTIAPTTTTIAPTTTTIAPTTTTTAPTTTTTTPSGGDDGGHECWSRQQSQHERRPGSDRCSDDGHGQQGEGHGHDPHDDGHGHWQNPPCVHGTWRW